jgi:putative thioredoxin
MTETSSPWIVETTAETFEQDVIERSRSTPVVVDFWAGWCQPCRMLAPILDELAKERAGQFTLVKADTERIPQAAQFGVQALPTVVGVVDGQPVDFFVGLLSKGQIEGWLDRVIQAAVPLRARELAKTDPAKAETMFREAIAKTPQDASVQIELAKLLLEQQRPQEAGEIIEELERRGFLEPEAERIKAHLEVQSHKSADLDKLRQAAAARPGDLQAQLDLAEALAAAGEHQEALDKALAVVQAGPKLREPARKLMVNIFHVLPDDSPLVTEYRRKLAAALY